MKEFLGKFYLTIIVISILLIVYSSFALDFVKDKFISYAFHDLEIHDRRAYLATTYGIMSFNVDDSLSEQTIDNLELWGTSYLTRFGNILVSTGMGYFDINSVRIHNDNSLSVIDRIDSGTMVRCDPAKYRNFLYGAADWVGIVVIEIDENGFLNHVNTIDDPVERTFNVEVHNNILIGADCFTNSNIYFFSLDIPTQPEFIGSLDIGFWTRDMLIISDYLYSVGDNHLTVISIENPHEPEIICEIELHENWYRRIFQINSEIWIGAQDEILIFNIEDPDSPEYSRTLRGYHKPKVIKLFEESLYYVSYRNVIIYDFENMRVISDYRQHQAIDMLSVNNPFIYASKDEVIMTVFCDDQSNIFIIDTLEIERDIRDLALANNTLYAATSNGLAIVDCSQPDAPTLLAHTNRDTAFYSISIVNNNLVSSNNRELMIFSLQRPFSPAYIGKIEGNGFPIYFPVVNDPVENFTYLQMLADNGSNLLTLSLEEPDNPEIVSEIFLEDNAPFRSGVLCGDYFIARLNGDYLSIYNAEDPSDLRLSGQIEDYVSCNLGSNDSLFAFTDSDDKLRIYKMNNGEAEFVAEDYHAAENIYFTDQYIVGVTNWSTRFYSLKSVNWISPDYSIPFDHQVNLDIYPNPFNATTNISFKVDIGSEYSLQVYTQNGRFVTDLINAYLQPGYYNVNWDANSMPCGNYFLNMVSKSHRETRKIQLIK